MLKNKNKGFILKNPVLLVNQQIHGRLILSYESESFSEKIISVFDSDKLFFLLINYSDFLKIKSDPYYNNYTVLKFFSYSELLDSFSFDHNSFFALESLNSGYGISGGKLDIPFRLENFISWKEKLKVLNNDYLIIDDFISLFKILINGSINDLKNIKNSYIIDLCNKANALIIKRNKKRSQTKGLVHAIKIAKRFDKYYSK